MIYLKYHFATIFSMDPKNKKILKDYIRSQKERGVKDETIKNALIGAGWEEGKVSVGFDEVDKESSSFEKKEELHEGDLKEKKEEDPSRELENENKERIEEFKVDQEKKESPDTKKAEPMGVYSSQKNYKNLNVIKEVERPSVEEKVSLSGGGGEAFLRVALVVVITVVIMGCVSVAAYYILQDLLKEEEKSLSKEAVLSEVLVSYMKNDSVYHETEATVSVGEAVNAKASASGFIQKAGEVTSSPIKADFDIKVKTERDERGEVDMEGSFMIIEDIFYIYLNQGSELPFIEEMSSLEEKWFSFKKNKDSDEFESGGFKTSLEFSDETISVIERYGVDILKKAQESGLMKMESVTFDENVYRYEIDIHLKETSSFVRNLAKALPFGGYKNDIIEFADEIEKEWEKMKSEMKTEDVIIYLEVNIEKNTMEVNSISINVEGLNVNLNEEISPVRFYLRSELKRPDLALRFEKPGEAFLLKEEDVFGSGFKMGTSSDIELFDDEVLLSESETDEGRDEFSIRNFLRAGAAWFGGEI